MEVVKGKQSSTVVSGNSQKHYRVTREVFLRLVSLPEQPVDSAISSRKQHDCDDRQQQSRYEKAVHAVTAGLISTSDQSPLLTAVDTIDLENQQCYGMLRDELILKNLFMRLLYATVPGQQQYHEDIPGNVFFEWVGNTRISEKNLRNVQHFKALSRFNGINVKVLVDKPITIVATEAKMDTMTGVIETITVAQLYKDFRIALEETGHPKANEIFKECVNRTEQHRIGLCTHALRSDYFRLALMYTYGGMHSDIAVSMEAFDPKRGSVEWPLIPLKGKNGFLIRACMEDKFLSKDEDSTVKNVPFVSSTLIASSKQNPIILSMLTGMLEAEDWLEEDNMSETSAKIIAGQPYAINDHDIMRLYQCSKDQTVNFLTNLALKKS